MSCVYINNKVVVVVVVMTPSHLNVSQLSATSTLQACYSDLVVFTHSVSLTPTTQLTAQ